MSEGPKIHRVTEPLLWLIPLLLSALGTVMIASTTSGLSLGEGGSPYAMGMKQLRSLLVGLGGMVGGYAIPTSQWRRWSGGLWILAWGVTAATLLPYFGVSAGGAQRWVQLGPLRFQASDLLSLAAVLHVARKISEEEVPRRKVFFRVSLIAILSMVPLLLQPNMGSALLVLALVMGMYVERHGWRYPLMGGVMGVLPLALLVVWQPYRMRRFWGWLNPWSDPLNTGFQIIQSLVAFANGGVWGLGVGHGLQKLQYLPESHTDFIFSAIGEELGLVGTLGVLGLFIMWAWRARAVYLPLRGTFEGTLVWGLVLTVLLPVVINVGGVTKIFLLTGLPLSFVSYGGSSLVMMWVRVGMLLRLTRDSREERPLPGWTTEGKKALP